MTEAPDLDAIVSALQREHEDAEDYYTQYLQPEQDAANRYYDAEAMGDEVEGKSQIVLPVVQEVVAYMMASVLRTFLSGERVIEFEATTEEEEAGAEEATAAIHYNFMREQDGARILTDWLQSGLLEKIGPCKTICETEEKVTREQVVLDTEQALAVDAGLLDLGEGAEIEDLADNGDGTFALRIKRTKVIKRYRDVPLPLEEFRFSRNARHEDDADYLAHVSLKTRSELVEMGFDREQVYDLPVADELGVVDGQRDWERLRDTSELPAELQTVLLCEEYARMDVDGDGIAERIKVFRVEDQILIDAETGEPSIETISEQPISVFCPFPRAHRMVGNSLADKVIDLQRIESVIARQMNDGMFLANMPRPLVDMSSDYAATTVEDVLRPIAGSPIRYKGQPPAPFQAGLDVSKSLSVLEHWKGERESRTGITRLNQGLDAETLNKTATGAALLAAQGQQMEESVARTFGEAFGRLAAKKLRLMKAEGAQFPIKVDGQYRTANAANWPDEFRLIIRVGLGTGRKEQRLQYLFALGDVIERAMPTGEVRPGAVSRLGSEIVSAMQVGQGDDYFIPPDELGQMPQTDPEADAMQAEMAKEQAKVEAKAMGDQLNAEVKLQTGAMKAQADAQIARERLAQETQLRREEMAEEARLKTMGMVLDAETKRTQINDAKPGGSVAK